jgi:hypothetical protein
MKDDKHITTQISKPDDTGGFMFSSGIRIFDPNSNEIFINKRGDD